MRETRGYAGGVDVQYFPSLTSDMLLKTYFAQDNLYSQNDPNKEFYDQMRALAAEITREKIYLRLHQELPYRSTVETEVWKELRDGSVRIEQTIYVERESQRAIVLGKGGTMIRDVGTRARLAISELLQRPAHIKLTVRIEPDWTTSPEAMAELGYQK